MAESGDERGEPPGLCASDNFGSGYAGLQNMWAKDLGMHPSAASRAGYGVRISTSGATWAKCEGLRVTIRFAPLRRAKVA